MKELELTCRVGKEISEDELRSAAAKALGVGVKSVGEPKVLKTTRFLNITTSTMQSR